MGDVELKLSGPDSSGQRLVLTHWQSQQCWSTWMEMTYKVFRFDWDNGVAQPVLAEDRSFWFDDKDPFFVVSPTQVANEFWDSSVSGDVHHRTKIERYLPDRASIRLLAAAGFRRGVAYAAVERNGIAIGNSLGGRLRGGDAVLARATGLARRYRYRPRWRQGT